MGQHTDFLSCFSQQPIIDLQPSTLSFRSFPEHHTTTTPVCLHVLSSCPCTFLVLLSRIYATNTISVISFLPSPVRRVLILPSTSHPLVLHSLSVVSLIPNALSLSLKPPLTEMVYSRYSSPCIYRLPDCTPPACLPACIPGLYLCSSIQRSSNSDPLCPKVKVRSSLDFDSLSVNDS